MLVDGKQKAYEVDGKIFHCGTNVTLHFIGGKWKSIILWYLRNGEMRFSELKRLMPDITEKMLSIQLKALQADGLIKRQVFGISSLGSRIFIFGSEQCAAVTEEQKN